VDCGPGYRIYCAAEGNKLVLLLCGGDKRRQKQDIEIAHDYWKDHQDRSVERTLPRR
jgi:putative addiction module killer protein